MNECGVESQTSVSQAKKLDEKNGNALWINAMNAKIENLKVTSDILEDEDKISFGCSKESGNLLLNARETLEHKARWVKDGNRTPRPKWSTFSEVVSRDSARAALT